MDDSGREEPDAEPVAAQPDTADATEGASATATTAPAAVADLLTGLPLVDTLPSPLRPTVADVADVAAAATPPPATTASADLIAFSPALITFSPAKGGPTPPAMRKPADALTSAAPASAEPTAADPAPVPAGVAGESAEIVVDEGVGIPFEPENVDQLVAALERFKANPAELAGYRERCLAGAQRFDRANLAMRMLRILEDTVAASKRR